MFSVLFSAGKKHGKFVVSMMREVSRMVSMTHITATDYLLSVN